jgi:hypothetical protein
MLLNPLTAGSYLLWKFQCRLNRPLLALLQPGRRRAMRETWDLGQVQAHPNQAPLCVIITSHKRQEACTELLQQVYTQLPAALRDDAVVIVLEDVSGLDYSETAALGRKLFGDRFHLLTSRRWLGKPGYWLMHQAAFELLHTLKPQRTLFIQDDLTLTPSFIARALTLWDALKDPHKAVLSLVSFDDDEVAGRWTNYERHDVLNGQLRKTQWFDLHAYLVDGYFLNTLRHRVFPADPLRFFADRARSSGVGEQFTRRLWGRGNIYQVVETLAYHGAHASVMNADSRAGRPFDNRRPP